jgi:hypothetical protein
VPERRSLLTLFFEKSASSQAGGVAGWAAAALLVGGLVLRLRDAWAEPGRRCGAGSADGGHRCWP